MALSGWLEQLSTQIENEGLHRAKRDRVSITKFMSVFDRTKTHHNSRAYKQSPLSWIMIACFGLLVGYDATAQQTLEWDVSTGGPAGAGPTVAPQTVTLRLNTNNPTGNTFGGATGAQIITTTLSFANQQFTGLDTTQYPTGVALSFGGSSSANGTFPLTGTNLYNALNGIGSPSNSQFSSLPTTVGAGITAVPPTPGTGNGAIAIFTPATVLNTAGAGGTVAATNGRYYYGDLIVTFSTPLTNPMLHFSGLGGSYTSGTTTLGFSTELDLDTTASPNITLSRISGSTNLDVTSGSILNSGTTLNASCQTNAACGSILATGSNISSIRFRIFLRGDGGLSSWSAASGNSSLTGDLWYFAGVSVLPPADMSPALSNLPASLQPGQSYTGLTLTCSNAGPFDALAATCSPSASAGTVSNVSCTPTVPATVSSSSGAVVCTFNYAAPPSGTAPTSVTFSGSSTASNDSNGGTNPNAGNNATSTTVPVVAAGVVVSGRVYREASTPPNTTDNGNAVDPGQVTQVALSCTPAYTGSSSVTTNADGTYSFTNVPTGATCTITETQPAGYTNAYNTLGAGGTAQTGGVAGTTTNGTITLTVPATGSAANSFAQESADTTSTTSCLPANPVAPGAAVSCTVTCTNNGPGAAVGMSCAITNAATLPGAPTPTCSPSANVVSGGTLSCTAGFNAPLNGSVTVNGGSAATNDVNGGTTATAGNNPSSATVSISGVNVSGRVYREASTPANTADDGNAVDPGLVTQVALSCAPAYTGTTPIDSNADGTYSFANVPAGATCTITETQPSGYTNAYNTLGTGGTAQTGGATGSTANGTITLTVPNAGSTGNNFAAQSADMVSTTSCTAMNGPTGAQISCTVTCTNNGPGAAVGAFCAVTNLAALPSGTTATCSPTSPSLAPTGTLSCSLSFAVSPASTIVVTGGTGSNNDSNGGITPNAGNNSSATALSAAANPIPTLPPIAMMLLALALLLFGGPALRRVQ
jgi:predicted anti-sigma-YlaC factor YlaD